MAVLLPAFFCLVAGNRFGLLFLSVERRVTIHADEWTNLNLSIDTDESIT